MKVKKIPTFKAYEIIRRLVLFSDLLPEELRILSDNQQIFYQIPAGDVFIKEGEVENCFYLLLSGSAKVINNRKEFDQLSAGDVIGVCGLVREAPRTASVVAQSTIFAMRITRLQFRRLPGKMRELIKDHMMEELVRRIDRLNEQLHCCQHQ